MPLILNVALLKINCFHLYQLPVDHTLYHSNSFNFKYGPYKYVIVSIFP